MIQPAIFRRATLPSEYKIFRFLGVVARLDKDPAEFDNFLKVIRSYAAVGMMVRISLSTASKSMRMILGSFLRISVAVIPPPIR
jgi:hypothetical protein